LQCIYYSNGKCYANPPTIPIPVLYEPKNDGDMEKKYCLKDVDTPAANSGSTAPTVPSGFKSCPRFTSMK
jgi:hypothetical protein